jgi:hypothetical protein
MTMTGAGNDGVSAAIAMANSKTTSCSTDPSFITESETKLFGIFPPVHPMVALACLPLLPTWFFLNRGYTQWFHWTFIFYMVTGQKDFWRRFLILQGGAVCAGWYLAVVHEYVVNGRMCHLLYSQMPSPMRALMLVDGKMASNGIITDTPMAWAMILASHIIDLLAHPVAAWIVWKMHTNRGGSFRNLVTWDVFWGSVVLSRVYSMVHLYYNNGKVDSLFYYGFDVYSIDTLDSYTMAYIGEGIWFSSLALWKIYRQWNKVQVTIRIGKKKRRKSSIQFKDLDRQKPKLIQSESCFSTDSNRSISEVDDENEQDQ